MGRVRALVASGVWRAKDLRVVLTGRGSLAGTAAESLGLGVLATALAALLLVLGPPGNDFAGQQHMATIYAAHGFTFWDNAWYAGRYSLVTYSLLFDPLAVAVGIRTVVALSVGVAVVAFSVLLRRRWGPHARWPARSFVLVMAAFTQTGAFPFALAVALGLVGLCALQVRRWSLFAVLLLGALASSPLGFLLVALVVVAIAIADRPGSRWIMTAFPILGAVGLIELVLTLLFASRGYDPFSLHSLIPAIAFGGALSASAWRIPQARVLVTIGILYCVACVVVFGVTSTIGEGITRFRLVALPLALLAGSLRSWRPRVLIVGLVACTSWFTFEPDVNALRVGVHDRSVRASYWQPAVAFLHTHSSASYRTEVVDTAHHWAAAYLPAAGLPIVRGWFRQDDFPLDRTLYGPFSAATYQRWLRGLGVRYVVLTDSTPDVSAVGEAALIRSGRSGLQRVFVSAHLSIFAVPAPQAIVTGPGRPWIQTLGQQRLDLVAPAAGTLRLAVHGSPYWHASSGCLSEGADGLLRLRVDRPGPVHLQFAVDTAGLGWALTHGGAMRPCSSGRAGAAPAGRATGVASTPGSAPAARR